MSFVKGDFFHVIGNENDLDWYEACNPSTEARGMVPVSYFQVLGRNERESVSAQSSASTASATSDSSFANRTDTKIDSGFAEATRTMMSERDMIKEFVVASSE